jgi:rfaE bifunctional protein nucleotidyltransferase chain/domain
VRSLSEKILPRQELALRLEGLRGRRTVVLANGIFDLVHVGHRRYLEAARALGDLLVVALNDDASARRLKGPGRPLVPEAERAEVLAGFRAVDFVTLFGETEVAETLRLLRPRLQAKGTDYRPETLPDAERRALEEIGGRVAIAGDPKSHSTRDLVALVLDRYVPAGPGSSS